LRLLRLVATYLLRYVGLSARTGLRRLRRLSSFWFHCNVRCLYSEEMRAFPIGLENARCDGLSDNQQEVRSESAYLAMVASFERSSKCAASTADTIAPSSADKSHISSVTRNLRARLKKAAGPLDALTAMTCRGFSSPGFSGVVGDVGDVLADDWSGLMAADF